MSEDEVPMRPVPDGDGEYACPNCGESLGEGIVIDALQHCNYQAKLWSADGRLTAIGDGGTLSPRDEAAASEIARCENCWQPLLLDDIDWE